ncbi:MAG: lamin tail domain-containing protein [Patescibacteria group bacterium]
MNKKVLFFIIIIFLFFSIFFNYVRSQGDSVIFSEICPTGCGESGFQWIEIYNQSDTTIDLTNWIFFEGQTNHSLKISPLSIKQNFILESGEYALIVQDDQNFFSIYPENSVLVLDSSWGTLNKSGEEIGLKDSGGNFVEKFVYKKIENNHSLERIAFSVASNLESNWLEHPDSNSVGQKNFNYQEDFSNEIENTAPTAILDCPESIKINEETVFSAINSFDSDGDEINYAWDFGDGIFISGIAEMKKTFLTTGTLNIRLKIIDSFGLENIITKQINILGEQQNSTDEIILLINEFYPNPLAGNEWVEFYSNQNNLKLAGYSLWDGAGKIITFDDNDFIINNFFILDIGSARLNNSGDSLHLKNQSGEVIDEISYGISLIAPAKGHSLARIPNGGDTDSISDFKEIFEPTKNSINLIENSFEEETTNEIENIIVNSPVNIYKKSSVLINEIVSDPADDEVEFVELYNNTTEKINLNSWYLEDGSEGKTLLSGEIASHSYFVIENPKGKLNNSGDLVVLFAPDNLEIDKMVFGDFDDGNLADNSPAPKDPWSLIRKIENLDSDNDFYDFVLTNTITKGQKNILSGGENDEKISEKTFDIIINEIFPNPKGDDSKDEFIELKNEGETTVNLDGWSLSDSSKTKYKINNLSLKPNEFYVLKREQSKIALNNGGGDEVKLFFSDGSLIQSIKYIDSAEDDLSFALNQNGIFVWTSEITPGTENIIKGKSGAPVISIDVDTEVIVREEIIFDASDTFDPNNEKIEFNWNFGDGSESGGSVTNHTYLNEGIYSVVLKVKNSENESEKKIIINVKNSLDFVGGYAGLPNVEKIYISEILANPEGSDSTEFIELFNPSSEDINVSGLKLDDEDGGSRAYTFPEGTIILAGEYKIFGKQDTKLALNNTNDSVRYLYPNGTIIDNVVYEDALENSSYVRNKDNVWTWTGTLTPGEENILSEIKEKIKTKTINKSNMNKPVIETDLEKVRNEDVGDFVKLTGTVAVEPGILGSQYFYIVGSPGLQIYSYKKDFPDLKVGDKVEVIGELSETNGELRLKTNNKNDIIVIDNYGEPESKKIEIGEVNSFSSWLVKIDGEITEIKSSYMYIDDGSAELKVYFKKGAEIDKKLLAEGDLVSVNGILTRLSDGNYELLPRNQNDIQKTGISTNFSDQKNIENKENTQDLAEKYLTATAGALTAILCGLFINNHSNKLKNYLKKFKKTGLT